MTDRSSPESRERQVPIAGALKARMTAPISLRWKVAATVSVVLLAVSAVISVALIRYQRFYLLEEGEKRALALATTLAVSARDPLLDADELRLGPVIQSIMQDPDTVYAYVLDHRGVVAFHPDTQLIGAEADAVPRPAEVGMLEAEVPVVVEGTIVGVARVGLSAEFVDHAARTTTRGLILRLGLGILLGLGAVLLLTDFHLRRLARLELAVRMLGSGDLTVRTRVRGRDELARLGRGFNSMVSQLQQARHEIEQGVTETVSALASTIEVNDAYTRGHCERVAQGTVAVAERLGIAESELRDVGLAAMLHDIGKIGVGTHILTKGGNLTAAELEEMQQHAALGARILSSVSFFDQVARYVHYHHEDWHGSGYPEGLVGQAIPLGARIIRVVDAFDAMTSGRPYRSAMSSEDAIRRIAAERGAQLDPAVVDVFIELYNEGTIGAIRRRVDEQAAA